MKIELENILPADIEKRSFEIITKELGEKQLPFDQELIIKRVIHTTADFNYADNLIFSEDAVKLALEALREGTSIITDTNMVLAGINKKIAMEHGSQVNCFMADPEIAQIAKENGCTRAAASMNKAASLNQDFIYAIGNAPTALVRLYELVREGKITPKLIIGVPVGFVNVVQSKELLMSLSIPYIVAKGRKGGSNVAAAICNALLYQL